MDAVALFPRYVLWHYSRAFLDVTRVFSNIVWFLWHLFSIPELLLNLFSPFERLDEKPKTFMPKDIAEAAVVSLLMRVVGALVRLPIILFGLAAILFAVALWVLAYILWIFLPIISPFLIAYGVMMFVGLL